MLLNVMAAMGMPRTLNMNAQNRFCLIVQIVKSTVVFVVLHTNCHGDSSPFTPSLNRVKIVAPATRQAGRATRLPSGAPSYSHRGNGRACDLKTSYVLVALPCARWWG